MNKNWLKLFLISTIVFFHTVSLADEIKIAAKIMDKISHALIKKSIIKVFVYGENEKEIVKASHFMKEAKDYSQCDLVLSKDLEKINEECLKKLVFHTSYKTFKKNELAVGAFFWQKGRPNIIFRENILKNFHIVLPPEFDKYIE